MDKPETIYLNVLRLYQQSDQHPVNKWWRRLVQQFTAAKLSLWRLKNTPWSTLLTVCLLGLMLALPLILELVTYNVKTLSLHWDKGVRIALYLKNGTNQTQTQSLLKKLRHDPKIARAKYISAEQGARELQKDLGNVLDNLRVNPLPAVIEVEPKLLPDAASVTALLASLENLAGVAEATLDMAWVQRLYYFLDLGERLTFILLLIFSIGVVLVISHTSKTTIKAAQPEITLLRLLGATEAWIRRPFLYYGIWCGLLGSLAALLLIQLFWLGIADPVNKLLRSYGDFLALGLNLAIVMLIIGLGIILGWLGAWLAYFRSRVNN